MAGQMAVWDIFPSQTITTGATSVATAIDISNASALAVHLTAIAGTALDVTFTYSLSNSFAGTYTTPSSPATIGANLGAVDVLDFAPEAARYIKITITNNSANSVVLAASLAVQEL